MSARAAWRLEALGFERVLRYQPGKDDWVSAGLPVEGTAAGVRRAFHVARRDVPTCGPDDPVAVVAEAVRAGAWPLAVVVGERRVVLGRLRPREIDERPDALAAELMVEGPRTVRGTRAAAEMAAWLDERRVPGVLVTSADGELVGYVRRDEL